MRAGGPQLKTDMFLNLKMEAKKRKKKKRLGLRDANKAVL